MTLDYLKTELAPNIIQIFFIVGLLVYTLLALVILKQAKVMSQTINGKYNTGVITFAWIHLVMSILLVAAAVIIL